MYITIAAVFAAEDITRKAGLRLILRNALIQIMKISAVLTGVCTCLFLPAAVSSKNSLINYIVNYLNSHIFGKINLKGSHIEFWRNIKSYAAPKLIKNHNPWMTLLASENKNLNNEKNN